MNGRKKKRLNGHSIYAIQKTICELALCTCRLNPKVRRRVKLVRNRLRPLPEFGQSTMSIEEIMWEYELTVLFDVPYIIDEVAGCIDRILWLINEERNYRRSGFNMPKNPKIPKDIYDKFFALLQEAKNSRL